MIRTREGLIAVVDESPFDTPAPEGTRRYVTILHEKPTADGRDALMSANSAAETFVINGREIYSDLDKDALGPGRFTDIETTLGMPATRRRWNGVTALRDLVR